MKLLLTPQLVKFLILCGYRYCLARNAYCETGHNATEELVMLIPLRRRPSLRIINSGFDALFAIEGEPTRMADEPDSTLILVQVESRVMLKYLKTLLLNHKKEEKCLNVY